MERLFSYEKRCDMTVANFMDALTSKVSISIVDNETDKEVLNVKNDAGVSANLADAIAGATVKRIEISGSTAIKVVIETGTP